MTELTNAGVHRARPEWLRLLLGVAFMAAIAAMTGAVARGVYGVPWWAAVAVGVAGIGLAGALMDAPKEYADRLGRWILLVGGVTCGVDAANRGHVPALMAALGVALLLVLLSARGERLKKQAAEDATDLAPLIQSLALRATGPVGITPAIPAQHVPHVETAVRQTVLDLHERGLLRLDGAEASR